MKEYTRIDPGTGREKPLTDEDWPNGKVKHWYIEIERVPGLKKSAEYYDCWAPTENDAWIYARSKARSVGPLARVNVVRELK